MSFPILTDSEFANALFPNLRVSPPDERLAKMAEGAARVIAQYDAESALSADEAREIIEGGE